MFRPKLKQLPQTAPRTRPTLESSFEVRASQCRIITQLVSQHSICLAAWDRTSHRLRVFLGISEARQIQHQRHSRVVCLARLSQRNNRRLTLVASLAAEQHHNHSNQNLSLVVPSVELLRQRPALVAVQVDCLEVQEQMHNRSNSLEAFSEA